jgi:hypothetical protein
MELIGTILFAVGIIVAAVGGIAMLVGAFKESVWWGLGSLFIPLVLLVFAFMHWDANKKWFFIWLSGFVLYVVGFIIGGSEVIEQMNEEAQQLNQGGLGGS